MQLNSFRIVLLLVFSISIIDYVYSSDFVPAPPLLPRRKYVEHTKPISINPSQWVGKRIDNIQETEIELTIGIKQRNLNTLEKIVWEVSDVKHPNYGKYLNFNQVKSIVEPSEESVRIVSNWLENNGIDNFRLSGSGDFIKGKVNVLKAQDLLKVEYQRFTHEESGRILIRSLDPYSVPWELEDHIDFIGGVNHFPLVARLNKMENIKKELNYVSPYLVRKVMNASIVPAHAANSQAIAQFLEEYFSQSDLDLFQQHYRLDQKAITTIRGPNRETEPGMETALDIQYITAMAPNVSTWIVSTGGLHEGQEPFLDWLVDMSSNPDLPYVHSISYGDDESSIEKAYTDRVDIEFQKYAAMGRTMVFSSGDSGVGCTSSCDSHVPGWPASSRFVLSVGGVDWDGTNMNGDVISGGGFSNYFPRPQYQEDVVSNYLSKKVDKSFEKLFNSSGRAYPDVSSFSESLIIAHRGRLMSIGGTSASAPIIAGLLSNINSKRLSLDQPTIGFVNPLLYKIAKENPESFYDIKTGSNEFHCCKGFKSSDGWDPVTGLGVPNFNVLLDYMTKFDSS
ncbi:peptidase S8 and S53 domain-containing protein [Heterostelium album PN500]|uniref:Peptidase S8 and S53 domain-containing protein n=1 Tax=Heterostelium pallidum (strain ATCC 26659 / Pp 5 / PN500) TaxID=670386 RepID=D3B433_HETP5|nr:peptidase S8 and S53 domain-containing protein [Heterostelium album PN500]EFA84081.1 peptidase S8 and S53 domain-containing protein [Heterostelium album PN500]|eukprot:XP_020436198.1 peptidase S8 and S53 domain-containing protein [Heterostelium album PN500]